MHPTAPRIAMAINQFIVYLRRRRRAAVRVAVVLLLALLSAEVFLSSHQESQVTDEADHLYAGYEYWQHADFGRNPEHPPLVKLVAASALLALPLTEPSIPYINFKSSDFYNGSKFLYSANADSLLTRGRAMLLPFALILALAIFAAGSEMFSPEAGLLAMCLFCLEPLILGNAGLILTDSALSCTMFLAVYTFYRYRRKPTPLRLALCAISVGFTLAAKQSGLLIFPILAIIATADFILKRRSPAQTKSSSFSRIRGAAMSYAAPSALILVISYGILWAFYGFRYSARPPGLVMSPTLRAYTFAIPNRLAASLILSCARHHLLPEAYLFGWADILQLPGTRFSFILGALKKGSWLLGFPIVFFIKTTVPLLALLLLVPLLVVPHKKRESLYLILPAAAYLLIGILSQMNAELRYILPIYPFLIVLAGAAAWNIARISRPAALAVAALFLFAAFTSIRAFPDYLAYTNEIFGGPSNSYRVVAGTNADAGQSLKWIKSYIDQTHTSDCWFDYDNPFVDPAYYGIPCKLLPSEASISGGTPPPPIPATITGTVLISTTEMAARSAQPESIDPYAQFRNLQPIATPGHIVLVYRGTFRVDLLAAYSHSLAAYALLARNKPVEALDEAQQAATLAPTSATIQSSYALALQAVGQADQGRQVNANALRLARSDHPEAQQPLIRLLELPGMTARIPRIGNRP